MKNLFKSYYRLGEDEFKTLWTNATFIFDTNLLLNFYRYQTSTRKALFNIMEMVSTRIWIPYHVGLEFQRNRLKTIADEKAKYAQVKKIVNQAIKKMEGELKNLNLREPHSHIKPAELLDKITEACSTYFGVLDSLEAKSIDVSSEDEIRKKIDTLFESKIGNKPDSQDYLDKLFTEGEDRYANLIPPGFEDLKKDDKKPEIFTYGGLNYKRKFGDLIIWKQIIEHAKKNSLKDIIFVTDDNKSDWWLKVDSSGPKTIGARPELIDEIFNAAGVERFYIYSPEGFLKYAKEQLKVEVTDDTIKEVREVSVANREQQANIRSFQNLSISAENAVYKWLRKNYGSVSYNPGFPDFIAYNDNQKYGFEVKLVHGLRMTERIINLYISRASFRLKEEEYYELSLVLVALNVQAINHLVNRLRSRTIETDGNLRIIIGEGLHDEGDMVIREFIPYDEIYFRSRT